MQSPDDSAAAGREPGGGDAPRPDDQPKAEHAPESVDAAPARQALPANGGAGKPRTRGLGLAAGLVAVLAFGGLITAGVRFTHRVGASLEGAAAETGGQPTIRFVKNPASVPALSFRDLDGRTLSSSDWRGKVVLVNFWATWCPPCRAEIPDLIALQNKYPDTLLVVGVSIDEGSSDAVKSFAVEHHMNYPIVMATPELNRTFAGVFAVPTTFVVDRQGRIVQKHVGVINSANAELEARALAGLPVNARIETMDDNGTVSLANAAQATSIPGIDLTKLSGGRKTEALKRLNDERCTCGCDLTVAQCRINDPSCDVSLPIAQRIVTEIVSGAAAPKPDGNSPVPPPSR